MAILSPTNFETLTYNMPNWSSVLNSNWQTLNSDMTKFNILWDSTAVNDKLIKWDSTTNKWIVANTPDLKMNLSATVNPVVTDDSSLGYSVGSNWINITAKSLYKCVDATVGAAVWISNAGDMLKAVYDTNNNGIVDSSQYDITTIAALENIPAYSPTTASGYIADSTNLGKICSGVSLTAITSGLAGNMATSGEISNTVWSWSTGDRLFLNGTIISKTAPTIGYVQQIGVAKNTTTIIINISNIIIL